MWRTFVSYFNFHFVMFFAVIALFIYYFFYVNITTDWRNNLFHAVSPAISATFVTGLLTIPPLLVCRLVIRYVKYDIFYFFLSYFTCLAFNILWWHPFGDKSGSFSIGGKDIHIDGKITDFGYQHILKGATHDFFVYVVMLYLCIFIMRRFFPKLETR